MDVFKSKGSDTTGAPVVFQKKLKEIGRVTSSNVRWETTNAEPRICLTSISANRSKMAVLQAQLKKRQLRLKNYNALDAWLRGNRLSVQELCAAGLY